MCDATDPAGPGHRTGRGGSEAEIPGRPRSAGADSDISIDPFAIPAYFARINALDFGWNHPTAAVKLAWDRDTDILYLTGAYRRKEATPVEHCATLKEWGRIYWAWPHDGLQHDKGSGVTLRATYETHGLHMLAKPAQFPDGGNGVEAGIQILLERMKTGRFKVFSHLEDWFDEFRFYHRKARPDGTVKIVKLRDDLLDATRYGLMCLRFADTAIQEDLNHDQDMTGRSTAAGY